MYAWITARRIRPGQMDAFKAAWEAGPRAPGLEAFYFLRDAADPDRMIGVAIWRDREAGERYVGSADQAQRVEGMRRYVEAVEWERFLDVIAFYRPPDDGARG